MLTGQNAFCRRSGPDLNVHVQEIVTEDNVVTQFDAVLYTKKRKTPEGVGTL